MSARLFDTYIAVDWSSANVPSPQRPRRDAIWVAERHADGRGSEVYVRTRAECRRLVEDLLAEHVRAGRRVFVGFDFPYGYPEGFARSIELTGDAPPWRLVWRELKRLVVDSADNSNNRFDVAAQLNVRCGPSGPGPFWGCPSTAWGPVLAVTSPAYPFPLGGAAPLERLRRAERRARGTRPVWQLWGAGSVGSQALVGVPTVAHLRWDTGFAEVSRVWPFETGFTPTPTPERGPFVLHAEIWPSLLTEPLDPAMIKDRAQVRALTRWLAERDTAGTLGRLFDRPLDVTFDRLVELSEEDAAAVTTEEGWIIGA